VRHYRIVDSLRWGSPFKFVVSGLGHRRRLLFHGGNVHFHFFDGVAVTPALVPLLATTASGDSLCVLGRKNGTASTTANTGGSCPHLGLAYCRYCLVSKACPPTFNKTKATVRPITAVVVGHETQDLSPCFAAIVVAELEQSFLCCWSFEEYGGV
jgi:hypothetical protein